MSTSAGDLSMQVRIYDPKTSPHKNVFDAFLAFCKDAERQRRLTRDKDQPRNVPLRLTQRNSVLLEDLAAAAGCTVSELVTRWITQESEKTSHDHYPTLLHQE